MSYVERVLPVFVLHYIATMLWAGEQEGDNMTPEMLSEEARTEVVFECRNFIQENEGLVEQAADIYGIERVAHHLYLTQNHHGAGFWDGSLPEDLGEKLTEAAHELGETVPYYGDDGLIYVCG